MKTAGSCTGGPASSSTMTELRVHLGAAKVVSNGAFFRAGAASGSGVQTRCLAVVNMALPALQGGSNWLNGISSSLSAQLQLGLLAANSIKPGHCQSTELATASISKALFGTSAGGGGKGFGGWGRGGGGGSGGDGFGVPSAGESTDGTFGTEVPAPLTEDVIVLDVGGMSCGGCASSVKRILEAQPQVKEATVDLATETAVVQVTTEPVAPSGWEAVKRELGESLAKHLTSCGFKSSLKDDGEKAVPAA